MKKYKVVGPRAQWGHEPGSTFEADLPEPAERAAIEAGHIQPVRKKAKSDQKSDKEE